MIARGRCGKSWGREMGMTANRYGVSFGNEENVLKLIMMMVV